ncbi:hypothetical protein ACHAXT_006874 [Thalassiosira profunda]
MRHKSRKNKSSGRGRRKGNAGGGPCIHANPAPSEEAKNADVVGDLQGMEQWIESLTYESLTSSLEFTFHASDGGITSGQRQGRQTCAGGQSGMPAGSHEFDLLMEMASMQGRDDNVLAFCQFSEADACYGWRRSMRERIDAPCLFRWADAAKDTTQDTTDGQTRERQDEPASKPPDNPLASLGFGGAGGMPSELLDVLAKAGVKRSTSALLETFNEVDEMDEAFESLDDCQKNMEKAINVSEPPSPMRFRVEVHPGMAEDGMPLGRGATAKQQNADRSILLGATFVRDRELGTEATIKCRLSIDTESATNEEQRKKLLLDMLRVASRGQFLTKAGEQRQAYLAPWLDPTQRWFPLPLYLASRFEAALWDAYAKRDDLAHASDDATEKSIVHSVTSLDKDARGRVLGHALGAALRFDLNRGTAMSQSSPMDSIRESLVWKLLLSGDSNPILQRKRPLSNEFASTPLLEWASAQSELKSLAMDHLQEGLAHEAERSLMQSAQSNQSKQSTARKKQKRRLKKKEHSADKAQPEMQGNALESDNSSDEEDLHVEDILHNTPASTLAGIHESTEVAHSSQSKSNAAKMAVLKALDDILNNVFARLGIEGEQFEDFTDAVTVKSRGESLHDSPLIDKTRSVDAMEVAVTALMSDVEERAKGAVSSSQRRDHRRNHSLSSHPFQPMASRSRRQTLEESNGQNAGNLKRSKSSGGRSMAGKTTIDHPTSSSRRSQDDHAPWPTPDSPMLAQTSQNEVSIFDGAPLCLSGALDGWNSVACQKQKESDTFADLLRRDADQDERHNFASSTVASLASSREDMGDTGLDIDDLDPSDDLSPPPSAPPTPPPRVSPILVSLADLGKLRDEATPIEVEDTGEKPPVPLQFSGVRPKLPSMATPRSLTPSLSRDDLRSIDEGRRPPRHRDDHHTMGHRQVDALLSYRNVVAKQSVPAVRKPPSLKSYDGIQKHMDDAHPVLAGRSSRSTRSGRSGIWPPGPEFPSLASSVSSMPRVLHLNVECARSEGGLDDVDDVSHCNVIPRAQTDDTMTKDGATTISSAHQSPREEEQASTLREERNSYRDMCLTLGAENAKLRNLLASATCTPLQNPPPFAQEGMAPHYYRSEQQFSPPSFSYPNQFSTRSMVAMSDAGANRGDYESLAMSEEGNEMHPTVVAIHGDGHNTWQAVGDSVQSYGRRTSGGGTYAESDTSLEYHAGGGQDSHAFSGFHRVHHQDSYFGPIPLHGIQSRLSKDINRYMQALKAQLKKTEPRRMRAIKQLESMVKALWPRAQIKMYGSHVTKLCLPSSDLDFVISLPAVHKNAPATAPGDLEGRNAIVETNQKVLARRLKSESWIDQRTLKVIERTAVPVIKVSTKDSRSRAIQLDLSFDAKEHHGLEALHMIQRVLEQLPMVRPLVLVLKQFLLDRGLLTAYTGGLSSYCLFLMVARYCQEQAPTWNDCGSLLMGLLDFYGNFFDPRTTGISVRTRQYFFRSQESQHSQHYAEARGWNQFPDLAKRNSFSSKPHRFQPMQRQLSFQNAQPNSSQTQFKSAKFDPIWVECPLNPGNNVGRNAFRIFQVQRAFSDAHRALVASLEWDINSMHEFGDDSEYPLLKSLLQNEDVFLELEDPIHR